MKYVLSLESTAVALIGATLLCALLLPHSAFAQYYTQGSYYTQSSYSYYSQGTYYTQSSYSYYSQSSYHATERDYTPTSNTSNPASNALNSFTSGVTRIARGAINAEVAFMKALGDTRPVKAILTSLGIKPSGIGDVFVTLPDTTKKPVTISNTYYTQGTYAAPISNVGLPKEVQEALERQNAFNSIEINETNRTAAQEKAYQWMNDKGLQGNEAVFAVAAANFEQGKTAAELEAILAKVGPVKFSQDAETVALGVSSCSASEIACTELRKLIGGGDAGKAALAGREATVKTALPTLNCTGSLCGQDGVLVASNDPNIVTNDVPVAGDVPGGIGAAWADEYRMKAEEAVVPTTNNYGTYLESLRTNANQYVADLERKGADVKVAEVKKYIEEELGINHVDEGLIRVLLDKSADKTSTDEVKKKFAELDKATDDGRIGTQTTEIFNITHGTDSKYLGVLGLTSTDIEVVRKIDEANFNAEIGNLPKPIIDVGEIRSEIVKKTEIEAQDKVLADTFKTLETVPAKKPDSVGAIMLDGFVCSISGGLFCNKEPEARPEDQLATQLALKAKQQEEILLAAKAAEEKAIREAKAETPNTYTEATADKVVGSTPGKTAAEEAAELRAEMAIQRQYAITEAQRVAALKANQERLDRLDAEIVLSDQRSVTYKKIVEVVQAVIPGKTAAQEAAELREEMAIQRQYAQQQKTAEAERLAAEERVRTEYNNALMNDPATKAADARLIAQYEASLKAAEAQRVAAEKANEERLDALERAQMESDRRSGVFRSVIDIVQVIIPGKTAAEEAAELRAEMAIQRQYAITEAQRVAAEKAEKERLDRLAQAQIESDRRSPVVTTTGTTIPTTLTPQQIQYQQYAEGRAASDRAARAAADLERAKEDAKIAAVNLAAAQREALEAQMGISDSNCPRGIVCNIFNNFNGLQAMADVTAKKLDEQQRVYDEAQAALEKVNNEVKEAQRLATQEEILRREREFVEEEAKPKISEVPTSTYNPDEQLAGQEAEAIFKEHGLTKWESEPGATKLEGLRSGTIDVMIDLKTSCGCDLTITGAAESAKNDTEGGIYSHANGYKFDARTKDNPALVTYIKSLTVLETRADGSKVYSDPSKPNVIYTLKKNNLDVQVIPSDADPRG